MDFSSTPELPYYAVIFSSELNENSEGYDEVAKKMLEEAKKQKGFLGVESARDKTGITISYWKDLKSIENWRDNEQHLLAQKKGKKEWYKSYKVRITKVEREYEYESGN